MGQLFVPESLTVELGPDIFHEGEDHPTATVRIDVAMG